MAQEEIREIIKYLVWIEIKRQHDKICEKQGKNLQYLQMQKNTSDLNINLNCKTSTRNH